MWHVLASLYMVHTVGHTPTVCEGWLRVLCKMLSAIGDWSSVLEFTLQWWWRCRRRRRRRQTVNGRTERVTCDAGINVLLCSIVCKDKAMEVVCQATLSQHTVWEKHHRCDDDVLRLTPDVRILDSIFIHIYSSSFSMLRGVFVNKLGSEEKDVEALPEGTLTRSVNALSNG